MKKVRNIFLVALTLLSVISMGSVANTYAKYTSSETDTDTARVAKWDVKFGADRTLAFNLFDTILDTDGTNETDVKDGNPTENIIAPGTKGVFSIDITNGSEVNADLFASFKETNTAGIPLQYKITYTHNGVEETDGAWHDSINDITIDNDVYLPFDGVNTATLKVEWQWPYEKGADEAAIATNDQKDKELGEAGNATVAIEATLRATQRD